MNNYTLNILTFPFWWYTEGLSLAWQWAVRQYHLGLQRTGLLLFTRHLREPMFGDYTRSGIIVGFFLRLALLCLKLLVFALRLAIVGLGLIIYLLVLPGVIVMIVYQAFPA